MIPPSLVQLQPRSVAQLVGLNSPPVAYTAEEVAARYAAISNSLPPGETKAAKGALTFLNRCAAALAERNAKLGDSPADTLTATQRDAWQKEKDRTAKGLRIVGNVARDIRTGGLSKCHDEIVNLYRGKDPATAPLPAAFGGAPIVSNAERVELAKELLAGWPSDKLRDLANTSKSPTAQRLARGILAARTSTPAPNATSSPTKPAPTPARAAVEVQAGADWDNKHPDAAGFSTRERYVAYRAAVAEGRLRVIGTTKR